MDDAIADGRKRERDETSGVEGRKSGLLSFWRTEEKSRKPRWFSVRRFLAFRGFI